MSTKRLFRRGVVNIRINRALIGPKDTYRSSGRFLKHILHIKKCLLSYFINRPGNHWALRHRASDDSTILFPMGVKSPHERAFDADFRLDLHATTCVPFLPTTAENHFFYSDRLKGEPSNGSCQPSQNGNSTKTLLLNGEVVDAHW